MKWFLILWACPIVILSGWYGLSYYDMSFGVFMLTRQAHDLVFAIYGQALGLPPESIPPLAARAIAVDSLIVVAIVALRKRRAICAWYHRRFASDQSAEGGSASFSKDANLSSAP